MKSCKKKKRYYSAGYRHLVENFTLKRTCDKVEVDSRMEEASIISSRIISDAITLPVAGGDGNCRRDGN